MQSCSFNSHITVRVVHGAPQIHRPERAERHPHPREAVRAGVLQHAARVRGACGVQHAVGRPPPPHHVHGALSKRVKGTIDLTC